MVDCTCSKWGPARSRAWQTRMTTALSRDTQGRESSANSRLLNPSMACQRPPPWVWWRDHLSSGCTPAPLSPPGSPPFYPFPDQIVVDLRANDGKKSGQCVYDMYRHHFGDRKHSSKFEFLLTRQRGYVWNERSCSLNILLLSNIISVDRCEMRDHVLLIYCCCRILSNGLWTQYIQASDSSPNTNVHVCLLTLDLSPVS